MSKPTHRLAGLGRIFRLSLAAGLALAMAGLVQAFAQTYLMRRPLAGLSQPVQADAITIPTCAAGQVLTADGTSLSCVGDKLTGYERVQSANVSIPGGGNNATLTISCNAGKKVLGGGCYTDANTAVRTVRSFPSNDTTWNCMMRNDFSSAQDFRAYAVCADVD